MHHAEGKLKTLGQDQPHTMRFGSTAKVLLKCKLKYYRISECHSLLLHKPTVAGACLDCFAMHALLIDLIAEDNIVFSIVFSVSTLLPVGVSDLWSQKTHLQEGGLCRVPGGSSPSSKQAEAHFAAVVEVGVEAGLACPGRQEVDLRGDCRIAWGKVDVKDEAAVCIPGESTEVSVLQIRDTCMLRPLLTLVSKFASCWRSSSKRVLLESPAQVFGDGKVCLSSKAYKTSRLSMKACLDLL